jgi:hypothetical protein
MDNLIILSRLMNINFQLFRGCVTFNGLSLTSVSILFIKFFLYRKFNIYKFFSIYYLFSEVTSYVLYIKICNLLKTLSIISKTIKMKLDANIYNLLHCVHYGMSNCVLESSICSEETHYYN